MDAGERIGGWGVGGGGGGRLTSWPTRTTVLDIFQDPTGRVYIYNRLKIKINKKFEEEERRRLHSL